MRTGLTLEMGESKRDDKPRAIAVNVMYDYLFLS